MNLVALAPNAFAARTTNVSRHTLWTLVSDPTLLPQFSDELQAVRVLGDGPMAVGQTFEGDQKRGEREWMTLSTVTGLIEGEFFEWTVGDLATPVSKWSFLLDDNEAGVTLAHRATLCGGPSPMSGIIAADPLGAPALIQQRLDMFRERLAVTVEGLIALAGGDILG